VHFRLPKPLHGWRAFAGEVAIIVLGVLIALGAEQVVETIHWRQRLHDSDRALELELGESVGQAIVRVRENSCVEQRLDWLAVAVDQAAASKHLPPIGRVPPPIYFTWPSGAWQSMVSGDIANHEDREKLQALSGAYDYIADINQLQRREIDVWTNVYQLVGPGRDFSDTDAASARAAISDARSVNRMIVVAAARAVQLLKIYDIPYDPASVRLYTDDKSRERAGQCKPMGAPEAHYGEAPWKGDIERVLANPLVKPTSS
jgi:hypothetical protein